MTISVNLTLVIICLIAGVVGTLVSHALGSVVPEWVNLWLTLSATLLTYGALGGRKEPPG